VAMGNTELDKRIDMAWQLLEPEAYCWFVHWICQQGIMVSPAADGYYALVKWPHVKSAFCHHFIWAVAITAVREAIRALGYSRGIWEVAHFTSPSTSLSTGC
jgi:hypothetical protein